VGGPHHAKALKECPLRAAWKTPTRNSDGSLAACPGQAPEKRYDCISDIYKYVLLCFMN